MACPDTGHGHSSHRLVQTVHDVDTAASAESAAATLAGACVGLVLPGGAVKYTITVRNAGPARALGVQPA